MPPSEEYSDQVSVPLSVHQPVLPSEVLRFGDPQPGQTWIDGTAGGGGHSRLIANLLGAEGRLLCLDRDPAAIERLSGKLPANCICELASYDEIPELVAKHGLDVVHGILLDLGLSSDQLADEGRGFSFHATGDLDLRFDPSRGQPAWEWLRQADESTIANVIYQYGEERFSRRIARRIVEFRKHEELRSARQLREIVIKSVPRGKTGKKRASRPRARSLDPATRTFQALRIFINDELSILEQSLKSLVDCLQSESVFIVISFHSLEDRLVKTAFREDPRLEIITKKPVQASLEEVSINPRARSAKLRAARRIRRDCSADSTSKYSA